MPELRVAISTPVDDNLYSLLISQLCIREFGVKVVGVITLNVWSVRRIMSEYKRLGVTLLRKIWNKYGLCETYTACEKEKLVMELLVCKVGLQSKSLRALTYKNEIPYIKVNNPNDRNAIDFLRKQRPDIILSIGSSIIRKPFLELPSMGVLNVHMGILPEYRGIGVTEWPIIEGRLEDVGLGITLHLMERGIDTGAIIMTRRIPIEKGDTISIVESKYLPEMVNLMISGVRMARDGNLESTSQKKHDGRQYFVLHKRMKIIAEKKLTNQYK
jgi:methionyl-tRNA formyltransferase